MKILITGAGGMLGHYLLDSLKRRDESLPADKRPKIVTLGLADTDNISVDLTKRDPEISGQVFTDIYHCAGTSDNRTANALNYDGTRRLCRSLEAAPPERFVYISCHDVYAPDAGTVDENTPANPQTEAGRSRLKAEEFLQQWCAAHGVVLTILRPARMFGTGVKGETLRLFNDAISGRYIHIRGNEAQTSIVTALDVAEAALRLTGKEGIFNVSDGKPVKFIDMVEAMTANAGAQRRMTHLPPKWAAAAWKFLNWLPIVKSQLNPAILDKRAMTQILDNSKCREATGISFYDTLKVISRTEEKYPFIN